jgi:hypothetical protein
MLTTHRPSTCTHMPPTTQSAAGDPTGLSGDELDLPLPAEQVPTWPLLLPEVNYVNVSFSLSKFLKVAGAPALIRWLEKKSKIGGKFGVQVTHDATPRGKYRYQLQQIKFYNETSVSEGGLPSWIPNIKVGPETGTVMSAFGWEADLGRASGELKEGAGFGTEQKATWRPLTIGTSGTIETSSSDIIGNKKGVSHQTFFGITFRWFGLFGNPALAQAQLEEDHAKTRMSLSEFNRAWQEWHNAGRPR